MRRAETIIERSLKRCSKCKTLKNFSEFSKHKDHYDGLASTCKKCKQKQDREYYKKNKKKVLRNVRKWASENRDKVNEASRKYWRKNKDRHKLHIIIRRARLAEADGSFTKEEWQQLKEKYAHKCAICGEKEPFRQYRKKLTIDHIMPISKGGSNDITNIQPACFNCNSIKKDRIKG